MVGRHLPDASYNGIQVGTLGPEDLEYLRVFHIRWPELEAMIKGEYGTERTEQ
jgi:hypothetical protein